MRRVIDRSAVGMLAAFVAVLICFGWGRDELPHTQAETLSALPGGTGLITHFEEDNSSNRTRVIVVDPTQRRMAVYHVEFGTGSIQLKSVRNLTVDLQIQSYNSEDPSPIDMQKLLQRN